MKVDPESRSDRLRHGWACRIAAFSLCILIWEVATAGTLLEEPIQPIPPVAAQDPARTEIGRQLFRDTRLSANGRVSCASCHDLAKGGVDGLRRSPGLHGELTEVNTPTVFNAALNFKQFWNGRADTLEAQIDQVVQNPVEMGSTWPSVIQRLSEDKNYPRLFAGAYKNGITKASIQNAIATYERTLITPNSRFDRFLRGDATAITPEEKVGYAKFKQFGCVACHQGVTIGGNMFERFGVMGDYFKARGTQTEADLGRYLVTKADRDRHVFKVPSLRNVALTAPYFHDASAKTLDEAVDVMFRYQLGRVGSREDKESIVRFLGTLTGELGGQP